LYQADGGELSELFETSMGFARRYRFRHGFQVISGLAKVLLLSSSSQLAAETNGVALTPPMGVNTWYGYSSGINETLIKSLADQMVTNGLKDAGYTYLNLDDGWAGQRDTNGVMQSDTNKFPSGIKALADYVHSKGLKFGLYATGGFQTCAGYPASMGYEIQDANTFALWGVDYLKYEACQMPSYELIPHEEVFSVRMGQALKQTGRPIVFSLSIGPFENWIPGACNLPRGTGDNSGTWQNVLYHIDTVAQSPFKSRPGMFNDPEVVPWGLDSGLTKDEAAFSMWCMLAAPLLTGTMNPYRLPVLLNSEAIAVDQDPAGIQGWCVATNGDLQVWKKPLGSSNSTTMAVALFNRGTNEADITANWSDLALPAGPATVRDLWAHAYVASASFGNFVGNYTAHVAAQSVQLLKITGNAALALPAVGTVFVSDLGWLNTTTNQSDPIQRDRWVGTPIGPMVIDGITYPKGLSFQANSRADYYLGGVASRFQCSIGIDDRACCIFASAVFRVYADGVKIYDSGMMNDNSPTQTIDVDVSGRNILSLELSDGGNGTLRDIGDWGNARLVVPPRPQIGQLQLNVNKLSLGGSNGAPNGAYLVLVSTNAAAPWYQWVPIRTNYFDNNGNFAISNLTVPLNPALFFRLKLQ
jgi:alpha-galactosidase